MQAIETTAEIDQAGNIKLLTPIALRNRKVRVLILIPDTDDIEDRTWLYAIQNPSFDFLNESDEDIYTLADGKPVKQ